jgi:hypothetical protein
MNKPARFNIFSMCSCLGHSFSPTTSTSAGLNISGGESTLTCTRARRNAYWKMLGFRVVPTPCEAVYNVRDTIRVSGAQHPLATSIFSLTGQNTLKTSPLYSLTRKSLSSLAVAHLDTLSALPQG